MTLNESRIRQRNGSAGYGMNDGNKTMRHLIVTVELERQPFGFGFGECLMQASRHIDLEYRLPVALVGFDNQGQTFEVSP